MVAGHFETHRNCLDDKFSLCTQADRLAESTFLGTEQINNPSFYWVKKEEYVTTYTLPHCNTEVLELLTSVKYTNVFKYLHKLFS